MPTEQTIDAEGTYIPFGDSAMRASHTPAPLDRPARVGHACPALRQRNIASEAAAVRGVREGKKDCQGETDGNGGRLGGGWHCAYLRLTTDEEGTEGLGKIRRKMNS